MKSSEDSVKLNKKIYEEARKQLQPLFSGFYPTSPQYRTYLQARKQIIERLRRQQAIMKALSESQPMMQSALDSNLFSVRFFCLYNAISHLFYVELFGNYYVNLALLLLVGKGHALHLAPDRKHRYIRHATSLKDIESPNLSLATKLDFLESNGLPFFKKWIETTLRNKIAHADFDIDENGNFFWISAKGNRKKVDIVQKVVSFANYHLAVGNAFAEYLFGKDWKTTKPPSQNKK